MHKFVFVLAAAGVALVMPISLAGAQTLHGMQSVNAATQNFPPSNEPLARDGDPTVALATSLRAAAGDAGVAPATDGSIRGPARGGAEASPRNISRA